MYYLLKWFKFSVEKTKKIKILEKSGKFSVQKCERQGTYVTGILYYRPKRSFGQGYIFTGVCLSTGGGACSKFWGGACSKFFGGCLLQILGGCLLQIFGGSPIFGIRSTFGRYASYWNAFLFTLTV